MTSPIFYFMLAPTFISVLIALAVAISRRRNPNVKSTILRVFVVLIAGPLITVIWFLHFVSGYYSSGKGH
jgi:ABC-type arginine/histidine transport system permease subunit